MIDTIRFQIEIDQDLYHRIRRLSVELSKRDNELEHEFVRILTKRFKVGSFDRHINIKLYDDSFVYLEFSVPKIFYGHNVYLISAEMTEHVCDMVRQTLIRMFGRFPEVYEWKIKRLDLCYAWRLPSEYVAEQMIGIFRGITINRKKHHFYDSSVMWYGSTQSIKFYQKYPEFYQHDFKELKKQNMTELAYQFLHIAEGVLRFEITLRGRALVREFCDDKQGNFLYVSPVYLRDDIIEKILNKYLKKVFKITKLKTMDNRTVYRKLEARYGTTKARNLYTFYKLLYSPDTNEKDILRSYSRYQAYRYISKLRECGIGISSDQAQIGFDFSIPSDYAVNEPRPRR